MKQLSELLRKAPFLRIIVPFIGGIFAGEYLTTLPVFYPVIGLGLLSSGLFILNKTSFRFEFFFGIVLSFLFFGIGFFRTNNQKFNPENYTDQEYFAVLDEYPVEKNKTFKAIILPVNHSEKILAYFPKLSALEHVNPGDILFLKGRPELINNNGNPFEFDYKEYLKYRKIGHQIFLKEDSFRFIPNQNRQNLRYKALILRNNLIRILQKNGLEGETLNVITSIALGARDELDKETLQSFANTGVIHVLSVSGLHVGIIFVVLNYLLAFMRRIKWGDIFLMLLLLSALWFYAFITGLSPAVLRATTMLSFFVIGRGINRNSNIFNTLAVSAFVLLFINPFMLFNVGFQLSYLSVIAIVLFQPCLYRLLHFKHFLPDKIWICLTVSVAAQIGVFPLTIAYFHQFPIYFWLTNLLVIIQSTLLIYLTFFIILISPIIPIAGRLVAPVLQWNTDGMLWSVKNIETLPYAVISDIYVPWDTMLLSIIIISLFTLYIIYRKAIFVKSSLVLIALLLTFKIFDTYKCQKEEEIIVFNIPGETVLAFTYGNQSTFILGEDRLSEQKIDYYIKPYCGKRGIKQKTFVNYSENLNWRNTYLKIKNGLMNFNGVTIDIVNESDNLHGSIFPGSEVLLIRSVNMYLLKQFESISNKSVIILSGQAKWNDATQGTTRSLTPAIIQQNKAIRLISKQFATNKKIIISNDF